ncbi:MFS transporter [Paraburkholderia sediminicola]|uniref:MFS transporter n=1 Tax=Paraburkholderia sediminicola TaxID=458836 RepID=UPI0038B96BDD
MKSYADTPAESDVNARMVLGICVAMGFTTLLDQAIFALAIPRLRDGLHASASQLQLIISIYSVAFGVALVPAGRLGDIIGRRLLFLIGLAMFAGFSVLGGLAGSAQVVIAARLLQGLGAGIINTQVLGLIQDLFQGESRAKALGRYASAGGLSGAVGPLLGGLVLGWAPPDLGWRLLFLINVPFGAVVFFLALRHLPRRRPQPGRFSLDTGGLALLSFTTLALMSATLTGDGGLLSARTCLAAAMAGVLLFACWEVHYQRRGGTPILARGLVRSPGYMLGTAVAMFQFAAGLTLGIVSTLFFLDGLRIGPLLFAGLSVSSALGMLASSTRSWRFVRRFGRAGVATVIAVYAILVVVEGVAIVVLPASAILLAYPAIGLLQGLASGLIHAPNQVMTLAEAGEGAGRGLAAGFLQLSQRLACSIGMSWGAGIFLTTVTRGAGLAAYRSAFVDALALVLALSVGALLAALADTLRRQFAMRAGNTQYADPDTTIALSGATLGANVDG